MKTYNLPNKIRPYGLAQRLNDAFIPFGYATYDSHAAAQEAADNIRRYITCELHPFLIRTDKQRAHYEQF